MYGQLQKILLCLSHSPTVKRWTCALAERFFEEKPSFVDKSAPKSNLPCLATSIGRKSHSFSVWVRYFRKIALIGHAEKCTRHRVVCFMLVYAQARAGNSTAIFIFWLLAVCGDDIIVPPAIVVFPRARCNYYIILTDYSP